LTASKPLVSQGFGVLGGFLKIWHLVLAALNLGLCLLFIVSLGSDVWEFYLALFLASLAPHVLLFFNKKNRG
jgi:hypothetical protein